MARDLRDVVNKIIVAVGDNDPTTEEIAGLASDLATFFDASVVLLYMGKLPVAIPSGPNQIVPPQILPAAMNAAEESARAVLDRMAEVMVAHGIIVSSRIVMEEGGHPLRGVFEKERADLIVLPKWETGVASRLARVISPSILEDANCPVLVLRGNRWLTESKAPRPSQSVQA
jgi:nucleotide-binding universal stress UspA family protein